MLDIKLKRNLLWKDLSKFWFFVIIPKILYIIWISVFVTKLKMICNIFVGLFYAEFYFKIKEFLSSIFIMFLFYSVYVCYCIINTSEFMPIFIKNMWLGLYLHFITRKGPRDIYEIPDKTRSYSGSYHDKDDTISFLLQQL